MKACAASACRQALRFEVIKRYESTEKSRERIKRYSTSVRGAAIRQRWANANPESLRASWEKANAKRKSQPEERECKTVLCANTFIVVGIAKAKRQFCDPCRKAHKGYQDTRRYWRKKRSRLRAA